MTVCVCWVRELGMGWAGGCLNMLYKFWCSEMYFRWSIGHREKKRAMVIHIPSKKVDEGINKMFRTITNVLQQSVKAWSYDREILVKMGSYPQEMYTWKWKTLKNRCQKRQTKKMKWRNNLFLENDIENSLWNYEKKVKNICLRSVSAKN